MDKTTVTSESEKEETNDENNINLANYTIEEMGPLDLSTRNKDVLLSEPSTSMCVNNKDILHTRSNRTPLLSSHLKRVDYVMNRKIVQVICKSDIQAADLAKCYNADEWLGSNSCSRYYQTSFINYATDPFVSSNVQLESEDIVLYNQSSTDTDVVNNFAPCLENMSDVAGPSRSVVLNSVNCANCDESADTQTTVNEGAGNILGEDHNEKVNEFTQRIGLSKRNHSSKFGECSYVMYKCDICDFETNIKNNLYKHQYVNHNNSAGLFKCSMCSYITEYKITFKEHQILKHGEPAPVIKCCQCPYTTKLEKRLWYHKRVKHDKEAPLFQCSLCLYATKFKYLLKRHIEAQHYTSTSFFKFPNVHTAQK